MSLLLCPAILCVGVEEILEEYEDGRPTCLYCEAIPYLQNDSAALVLKRGSSTFEMFG